MPNEKEHLSSKWNSQTEEEKKTMDTLLGNLTVNLNPNDLKMAAFSQVGNADKSVHEPLPETIVNSPHGEIRSRVNTLYQRMKNECPWCSQIALDCLSSLIELEYMIENGREVDEWWNKIAPQLRDYLGLSEPTIEDSQEEFDSAEEVPLTEDQIQEILEYVLNKKKFVPTKYILNGKQMELFKTYLSFSELVELAGYKKVEMPTICYYHKDEKMTRAGSLLPGHSIEILDGMVFNVVHTGEA